MSFVTKYWRFLIPPIAILAISAWLFFLRGQANELSFEGGQFPLLEEDLQEEQTEEVNSEPSPILVDVKGAVKYPGVYSLVEGDRLIDAIDAAGGYLPIADSRTLNHAKKLTDEYVVYVPAEGEEIHSEVHPEESKMSSNPSKININTADEAVLTTIPGIGPAKAKAIIQYRNDHGLFSSIEDIQNVSGIGEKTFEKLQLSITVSNE